MDEHYKDSIIRIARANYNMKLGTSFNDALIDTLSAENKVKFKTIYQNDLIFRKTGNCTTVEPTKNDQILLQVDVNKLISIVQGKNFTTSRHLMEFLQSGDCKVWSVFKISSTYVVDR